MKNKHKIQTAERGFKMALVTVILPYLLSALVAYLIGSISFSIIFTKLFTNQDVREHGSGNAGATNVLRTAGVLPAVLTTVLDFLKAVVAICVAWIVFRGLAGSTGGGSIGAYLFTLDDRVFAHYLVKYIAGFACVLGHIYPVYYGFRGGKGVLASAGLVLVIDWRVFLSAIAVFIVVVFLTRYVSLGSICAAASLPVWTLIFQLIMNNPFTPQVTLFAAMLGALLIWMHRANIGRLRQGTESKLGQKTAH